MRIITVGLGSVQTSTMVSVRSYPRFILFGVSTHYPPARWPNSSHSPSFSRPVRAQSSPRQSLRVPRQTLPVPITTLSFCIPRPIKSIPGHQITPPNTDKSKWDRDGRGRVKFGVGREEIGVGRPPPLGIVASSKESINQSSFSFLMTCCDLIASAGRASINNKNTTT